MPYSQRTLAASRRELGVLRSAVYALENRLALIRPDPDVARIIREFYAKADELELALDSNERDVRAPDEIDCERVRH